MIIPIMLEVGFIRPNTYVKAGEQMDQNLLKPSLQTEWTETESYDIGSIWYAAFFGGIVSTIIIASRNAFWLRIRPAVVYTLIGVGVIILFGQLAAIVYLTNGNWNLTAILALRRTGNIRLIRRVIPLGMYLLYYLSMKKPFQLHLVTKGELKPLLKDAVRWIVIGGAVEAIILLGGAYLLSYVF